MVSLDAGEMVLGVEIRGLGASDERMAVSRELFTDQMEASQARSRSG